MAMSYIWSGLVILSFLWGFFHGNLSAVAAAALDGAGLTPELSVAPRDTVGPCHIVRRRALCKR